jgi:hypothetical protein
MSRSYVSRALRDRVAAQARHRCGYCLTQQTVVGTPMELDHLIPEALGGRTEEANLWLACSLCNDAKNCRISALDPDSGVMVRLFNPREQAWSDHFRWSEYGDHVVALTSIGRATLDALNLNRPVLVQARRA